MALLDFTPLSLAADVAARRLSLLRSWMRQKKLDGYIVLHNDNYFSESPADSACCLYWLTGFSGSAGCAIILAEQAILFTDGRYQLQAEQQLDKKIYEIEHISLLPPYRWLSQQDQKKNLNIGYNPSLFSKTMFANWYQTCKTNPDIELHAITSDPFDAIWHDRPEVLRNPVITHPLRYAGRSAADKKTSLLRNMTDNNYSHIIISDPADVAWLCNIRGSDIAHTPIALLRAIVEQEGNITLFCDQQRLENNTKKNLTKNTLLKPENSFKTALQSLSGRQLRIGIDAATLPLDYYQIIKTDNRLLPIPADFCALPRACKNITEIKGAIKAHKQDAIAMCRFIHWYHHNMANNKTIDEAQSAQKITELRLENPLCRNISFPPISAASEHGAIMHYSVDYQTNKIISPDQLYLIDSGGQYVCGTTDVTRTLIHKMPKDNSKKDIIFHYTCVLKALIALCRVKFPVNASPAALDGIARAPLWYHGLNYDHGTGHGVGSYLSVHEGPQSISSKSSVCLQEGMIVSLEPGLYRKGYYGIRLENLALVQRVERMDEFLQFKMLTLLPFETRLIDVSLLNSEEKSWLNTYHRDCYNIIGSSLLSSVRGWLASATKAI